MNISWLFYFQLRLFSLLSNFSPPTIKSTVLIFLVSSSSEGCHPSSCFLNSRMVVSGVTSRTTTFPLICRTGTRKTSMAHQRKEIWPIYLHSMSILRFHVKVYRVANHGLLAVAAGFAHSWVHAISNHFSHWQEARNLHHLVGIKILSLEPPINKHASR